ncbi:DNA-directed RNA polymerase subunit alpha [Patescibacteria group bacterium]
MNIVLPTKKELKLDKKDNNIGILTIEPCYPGYGATIGNALRRVLLSSLEGAAVTAVNIKGVSHEFSTIPHIKEDVLEIILRLKKLRLKTFSDEPVKLLLNVKGEKEVKASDITKNSNVEIINSDLKIATLTSRNAELSVELTIDKGLGYESVEQKEEKAKQNEVTIGIGDILVDSVYSPIINVSVHIENVRVGQMTNYEKLILSIETDGTIDVNSAVEKSAKILIEHFQLLILKNPEKEKKEDIDEENKKVKKGEKKAKKEKKDKKAE